MRMGSPPATSRASELKGGANDAPLSSLVGAIADRTPDLDAIATGCVGELRRVLAALQAGDRDLLARLAVEGTVLRRDPDAPKPGGWQ